MPVITISRQLGSLGTEIAQMVAEELKYDYMDKEKIAQALADYGMSTPEVDKFDEKKPPFWDTLSIQRKKYLHLIQALIYDFGQKGNVVFVGRGGQVLLKDLPGVLHARIMAPFEVRVQRVMKQRGGDEKQAAGMVRRSDRDSAGFIRSYFDVDWEDQDLYDLILNTRKLSVEAGARIILGSIPVLEIKEGEKKAEEKLADLAFIQKVEASLLGILGAELRDVHVKAERGVITLEGTVASKELKENCQNAAARIKGVNRVDNQLTLSPYQKYGYHRLGE
jgi:cytidylate kinase